MKKLAQKLRMVPKDPVKDIPKPPWPHSDVIDPKYIVPSPRPGPFPSPPAPVPSPGPNNKGVFVNPNAHPEDDIGTFSGLGSWMALFEPDPNAQGIVEVAAQPVHAETAVSQVLSLEGGKSKISLGFTSASATMVPKSL